MKVFEPFSDPIFLDPEAVLEALLDCLRHGDRNAFREVLASYIITKKKAPFAAKAGISRRALYDLIGNEKKFNPELATVCSIFATIGDDVKRSHRKSA